MNPPRRVVLDTDVLFSRIYHETYGYLGAEAVVDVVWSETILDELRRVLHEHGRTAGHADAVCGFVRAGFPDGLVEPDPKAGMAFVRDPDDAHVAATAIAGRAEAIVTRNTRDYRSPALTRRGIAVIDPIAHLIALAQAFPEDARAAISRQVAASSILSSPSQLLELFAARGQETLADGLRRAIGT